MLALLECLMNLLAAAQIRVLNRNERGKQGVEVDQKREGGTEPECWGMARLLMKEALIDSIQTPLKTDAAQRELFILLEP